AALLRTEVLRAVGGVPAAFFCYYEDTDTSWRLRLAGWRILTDSRARVWHGHGASTGLGSVAFHRWNERNRLLTLLRCAPAAVAAAQLARFAAITALLPVRKLRGDQVPVAANFTVRLRAGVLAEVVARIPATVHARRGITGDRDTIWRTWSDRPAYGDRRQR
ncbi:MAG: glycosyltransferase family 2 protein, partial [Sciscionella sp.]